MADFQATIARQRAIAEQGEREYFERTGRSMLQDWKNSKEGQDIAALDAAGAQLQAKAQAKAKAKAEADAMESFIAREQESVRARNANIDREMERERAELDARARERARISAQEDRALAALLASMTNESTRQNEPQYARRLQGGSGKIRITIPNGNINRSRISARLV